MKKYDVIVVGAGPAGSMAAYHAAQAGLDVLMLEKHNQIGVPLCCAEAVTQSGLESVVEPKPAWIAATVDSATVYGPEGSSFTLEHPDAGYVLERKLFDRDLALRAAAMGVEIKVATEALRPVPCSDGFNGVDVIELGEPKRYLADLIIAADGVEGVIGRFARSDKGMSPKLYNSAIQFLVYSQDINSGRMEFYFDPAKYPSGYLWVFPKGNGVANVGFGAQLINYDGSSLHELLMQFCQERFSRFTIAERTSGGIPSFAGKHYLLKENIVFVGDAARVVDSLTGAGIVNAMLSGKIAGYTAGEYFKSDRLKIALKNYPKRFMQLKGRELSVYLKARKTLGKMKEKDFIAAIEFLKDYFPEGFTTGINGVHIALSLLRHNPRFIWLARNMVFG